MGKDDLLFGEEDPTGRAADKTSETIFRGEKRPWKLLVVDDETEVHATTRLVLRDFDFEGGGLEILSAYTGNEALAMMREHEDIAVVLLDVVMETSQAGLDCVRAIRQDLENNLVRIVLRTGQPGQAPERKVIVEYDINDYKNKSELTSQRLFTTVYTAIRSYRDMQALEKQRAGLGYIIEASGEFFKQRSIRKLAKGVLTQIEALFRLQNSFYISETNFSAALKENGSLKDWKFITATGKFAGCETGETCRPVNPKVIEQVQNVVENKKSMFFDGDFVGYFPTQKNEHHIIYMENCGVEEWDEVRGLLEIFTNNVGIAFDNIYLNQEIIDTQTEIVLRLGEVVESRSKETAYHVLRVGEYSYLLALLYGTDEMQASNIKLASPMHDIGKIGIPDQILLKPGKLTPEEFEIIKTHTEIGHKILKGSERELLKTAAVIAYTHHERWDGNGYPKGLKGEEIPLAGRVTALADVFDALACDRVYKKAWPMEEVFAYVLKERGGLFDPKLVDLFMESKDQIMEIRKRYADPV